MAAPGPTDALGPIGAPAAPVSVVMTARDEARHLRAAVASVFEQDYPGPLDLVVSVGPSVDDTLAIAHRLAEDYPRLRVVDNPTGRTPAGLNIAIAATAPESEIIVRTDGHATLPGDYVRIAVETLTATGAANVGGMMVPVGTTPFEQAVARAMSSRIGLGAVPFHTGGRAGAAETVYLGVFRRAVLAAVGGFDEYYVRAQDWELNYRIRRAGHLIWFDPRLQVEYRPRPNVRRLARQFHDSGVWRWQIIRARPGTASARYLAAPGATAALGASAALALVAGARRAAGRPAAAPARAGLVAPLGYAGTIALGALVSGRGLGRRARLYLPVVLATMHLAWGAGFLQAALSGARTPPDAPSQPSHHDDMPHSPPSTEHM